MYIGIKSFMWDIICILAMDAKALVCFGERMTMQTCSLAKELLCRIDLTNDRIEW